MTARGRAREAARETGRTVLWLVRVLLPARLTSRRRTAKRQRDQRDRWERL